MHVTITPLHPAMHFRNFRLPAFLLIFVLSLGGLKVDLAQAAGGAFAGGNGSGGSPYQIEDCSDLQAITNNTGASYILNNNIDCSATSGWNGGAGFASIGGPGNKFTGSLNGQGHVIINLTINRPGNAYTGLFSWVNGGTITNLGLVNATVNTSSYGAILMGYFESGTVTGVYATGNVTTAGAYIGGLVGYYQGGTLSSSFVRANVSNSSYSGGLAGLMTGGTIQKSFSVGTVPSGLGGGLVGLRVSGTVTNTFYDSTTSGKSDDDGFGKPKTTTEMKNVATFTNTATSAGLTSAWDFLGNPNNDVANSDLWTITTNINLGYPYLRAVDFSLLTDTTPPLVSNVSSDTANNSYRVGQVIDIDVTFSESVTSTGSVTVTLETGDTDRTCTFTVTSSASGTCNYTVQSTDISEDLTVNSIAGTIQDLSGNSMVNFVPVTNLAANKAIVIDNVGPTPQISSDSVLGGSGGSLTADLLASIPVTVTFPENVTGFDSTDLTLTNATISGFTEVDQNRVYTFNLAKVDYGTITVSIPAAAALDAIGNGSTASSVFSFMWMGGGTGYTPVSHHSKNSKTTGGTAETLPFMDVEGHFAYNAIQELYQAGIVQGRTALNYEPDSFSTRAEALKIILSALNEPVLADVSGLSEYSDVDTSAWYGPVLATASQEGYVSGYGDGTFKPDAPITRAETVKILMEAMGGGLSNPKAAPFQDIQPSDWFASWVSNAYILGLVQGRSADTFAPNDFITRGEVAVLVVRSLDLTAGN